VLMEAHESGWNEFGCKILLNLDWSIIILICKDRNRICQSREVCKFSFRIGLFLEVGRLKTPAVRIDSSFFC
jgi:hypothetical protein